MLIIPVPIIFRVIEFCNSIKRDPIYNFNLLFFFSEFQNPVKKKIKKEFNFQYSRPTFKLLSKTKSFAQYNRNNIPIFFAILDTPTTSISNNQRPISNVRFIYATRYLFVARGYGRPIPACVIDRDLHFTIVFPSIEGFVRRVI